MRITYPVATDSDYAVWLAFGNHYWPALYFADAQGRIRHHHFGEGAYGQSEMVIQQLLAEAGSSGAQARTWSRSMPAAWKSRPTGPSLRSPENYTGYERTENFASPAAPVPGQPHVYTVPARAGAQPVGPVGDWTMGGEATTLNAASGQLACRFHARDLNLVMGPATPATSSAVPRAASTGSHPARRTAATPTATATARSPQQRVYQLIRQPGPITEPHLRDHLPRPRRPGLLLHLRLDRGRSMRTGPVRSDAG